MQSVKLKVDYSAAQRSDSGVWYRGRVFGNKLELFILFSGTGGSFVVTLCPGGPVRVFTVVSLMEIFWPNFIKSIRKRTMRITFMAFGFCGFKYNQSSEHSWNRHYPVT